MNVNFSTHFYTQKYTHFQSYLQIFIASMKSHQDEDHLPSSSYIKQSQLNTQVEKDEAMEHLSE